MKPEHIPQELIAILDERAGKKHSRTGSVVSCLAEILTRYEELRATTEQAMVLPDGRPITQPQPVPQPKGRRAQRKWDVIQRFARRSRAGRIDVCHPGKVVIYPDLESASAAADEFAQIYPEAGRQQPQLCPRSRHGHYHVRGNTP